jgi:hypothetical protein
LTSGGTPSLPPSPRPGRKRSRISSSPTPAPRPVPDSSGYGRRQQPRIDRRAARDRRAAATCIRATYPRPSAAAHHLHRRSDLNLRMAASRVHPSLSAVVTSSPEQLAVRVERAPGARLLAQWIPTHSILASFASRSRLRADCRRGRPGCAAAAAHPSADDKTPAQKRYVRCRAGPFG